MRLLNKIWQTVRFERNENRWLYKRLERIMEGYNVLPNRYGNGGILSESGKRLLEDIKERRKLEIEFSGKLTDPQLVERLVLNGHEKGAHYFVHPGNYSSLDTEGNWRLGAGKAFATGCYNDCGFCSMQNTAKKDTVCQPHPHVLMEQLEFFDKVKSNEQFFWKPRFHTNNGDPWPYLCSVSGANVADLMRFYQEECKTMNLIENPEIRQDIHTASCPAHLPQGRQATNMLAEMDLDPRIFYEAGVSAHLHRPDVYDAIIKTKGDTSNGAYRSLQDTLRIYADNFTALINTLSRSIYLDV